MRRGQSKMSSAGQNYNTFDGYCPPQLTYTSTLPSSNVTLMVPICRMTCVTGRIKRITVLQNSHARPCFERSKQLVLSASAIIRPIHYLSHGKNILITKPQSLPLWVSAGTPELS